MNGNDLATNDPMNAGPSGEASKLFVNVDSNAASGQAPAAGSKPKGVPNQAIVALVLLVMSAGAIYGMRRVGTISGISGQELQVQYQPSAINAAFESRFDQAMNDLANSGRPVQVPAEVVPMTAFDMHERLTFGSEPIESEGMDPARLAELRAQQQREQNAARRAQHRDRIEDALGKLNLQSLIGGRVPVATISGRLVRVGDALMDGLLTVERIDGREVVVSDGVEMWVLRIGQAPTPLIEE